MYFQPNVSVFLQTIIALFLPSQVLQVSGTIDHYRIHGGTYEPKARVTNT